MKAPISVDGKVFHAAPRTHLASPPLISVTEVWLATSLLHLAT
ncbi:hypothetical protein HU200_053829 [Digitaria exilis]|uniref:Uncharacterized protein n=1 Tax=Digitaria exilis TaxID=1010633 RepID=A0A835AR25_9POAL|nr:hypothetical protein HU200_053829 [Digitaria exilis]